MNATTTLAIGAGLLLVSGLFFKSQALGRLYFYPYSVKNITFQGITPIMELGLAVQNTSSQSFVLRSIAGELYSQGYLIGNIGSFTPQTIAANSQSVLYINCRLSLLGIVSDLINAIKNKTFKQSLELDLTANIDNLQVPYTVTYNFGT